MKNAVLVVLLALASLAFASSLWAQVVSDPNDPLYTDLKIWEDQGLITKLPPLRPYPIQLITQYLKEVERAGTSADRARAADYLARIDKPVYGSIAPSALLRAKLGTGGTTDFKQLGLIGTLQGAINPSLSYSAKLGAYAMSGSADSLLPLYQRPLYDVVYDQQVNPIGTLTPRISLESQTAFGSGSTYFQAGIMRDSFGPFFGDSIVLSPTAPQAGNLSFTWQEGLFTYTSLLLDVSATQNNGAGGPKPEKYLAMHSLVFYPTSWLDLGIYETVVWGGRFEPLYLLPLPSILFYSQGLVGYPDNSFVGLSGGVKLPAALRLDAMLYVDDASFNDLIRLHFNTMILAAGQAGLSWTPRLPLLKRMSLNYTLVTPYTYSHQNPTNDSASATIQNYENYTNDGQSLATSLDPNSDRVEIRALIRPLPSTDVTLFGRYIRHGNPSEGISGINNPTGTVFDDGYAGSTPTFAPGYNPPNGLSLFRFLSQPVVEQIVQAGAAATLSFRTPIGTLKGTLSYTFEHVANALDGNGNPQKGVDATNSYVTVGVGMAF